MTKGPPLLLLAALPTELGGLVRHLDDRAPLSEPPLRAPLSEPPLRAPLSEPPLRAPLSEPALRAAWSGRLGQVPVIAAATGPGRRAVERGLRCILEHASPAACLFIGFAGGCSPRLRAGDLVLGDPVLVEPDQGPGHVPIDGRSPIALWPPVRSALQVAARTLDRPPVFGTIVTVNVVASPSAKDSLWRNRGALACDMESFWAERLAHESRLPIACLRAIFDSVEERLPPIPAEHPLRVIWRRPSLWPKLPGLALRHRRVRAALDRAVLALAPALWRAQVSG